MKNSIIAVLVILFVVSFPMRYAFLEEASNVASLLSFLTVLTGYFAVVFLFGSAERISEKH